MKFLDELEKVLSSDKRFIGEDNQIIKTKVSDAARSNDGKLLKSLLNHELLKGVFFTKVDDIYVFDKNKFVWVLESKEFLPDSYTMYKNKIGLVDANNNMISKQQDVSLVWPYKDCVLEGGQTKEDQKRDEIFYNETLALDQVNRLLAPKVLGNAKRYTKDGVEEDIEFNEDDNLIIKGNNLLALSSLLERYEGQVKCIYIDPPYNTGTDSFGYNDNFNHSTWLTFMKNRLEFAKRLLKEEGTLAISIDNNEIAYLLVQLDEIFGKENRKNIITVRRASVSGAKVINPGVVNIVEYVVIYSKNNYKWKPNRVFSRKGYDNRYNSFITNYEDGYENWKFSTVLEEFSKYTGVSKNKLKKYYGDNYEIELENFVISNSEKIIRFAALDDRQISAETRKLKKISKQNPETIFHQKREGFKDYYLLKGNAILFAQDRILEIDGAKSFSAPISDIWDDVLPNDLHNEGGVDFKKGKKPEKLVQRIIELCSDAGEIILDFHLGSGTTTAVAHKMHRRYIGIEQMNYIEGMSLKRMKNVINGEDRGISKIETWNGGGSFVYCELLEDNENLVNELEGAKDSKAVKEILNKAIDNGKLIPSVLPSDLKNTEEEFNKLSLDEQKNLVMELLNKNKLYVNLSDMDDEDYGVSESDKKFTRSFYNKE